MNMRLSLSCGAVVALAAVLSACGGNDSDEEGQNEGKSASERLVGTWEMDMEAMVDKMSAAATSDEDRATIQEGKDEILSAPRMTIEFTTGGKIITTVPEAAGTSKDEGTYQVKSEDGDSIVIHSKQSGKERDITMRLLPNDRLEIDNPQLGPEIKSMVFKRLK